MNSTKHTPGPWSCAPINMRGAQQVNNWNATTTVEEARANARLIAAAPDMLERLRAIVAACSCYGKPGPIVSACSSCEKSYTLIAKAEGKS